MTIRPLEGLELFNGRPEETQEILASQYRRYDLETGASLDGPDPFLALLRAHPSAGLTWTGSLERLGLVIGRDARARAGGIFVLDANTGRELQRIKSVAWYVAAVSPDERWALMRSDDGLLYYRVSPPRPLREAPRSSRP